MRQGSHGSAGKGKCLNACYFAEVEGIDLADLEFFLDSGADDQDMIRQGRAAAGSGGGGDIVFATNLFLKNDMGRHGGRRHSGRGRHWSWGSRDRRRDTNGGSGKNGKGAGAGREQADTGGVQGTGRAKAGGTAVVERTGAAEAV